MDRRLGRDLEERSGRLDGNIDRKVGGEGKGKSGWLFGEMIFALKKFLFTKCTIWNTD